MVALEKPFLPGDGSRQPTSETQSPLACGGFEPTRATCRRNNTCKPPYLGDADRREQAQAVGVALFTMRQAGALPVQSSCRRPRPNPALTHTLTHTHAHAHASSDGPHFGANGNHCDCRSAETRAIVGALAASRGRGGAWRRGAAGRGPRGHCCGPHLRGSGPASMAARLRARPGFGSR